MSAIEPTSSGSQLEFEQRFWEALLATMQTLFPSQVDAVERYKKQLDNASSAERLLALHDDPIDVAAVLTGSAITPAMLELYDGLLGRLDNFSRRSELDTGVAQTAPLAKTTMPITLATLDSVLKNFGYAPAPRRPQAKFLTWEKVQAELGDDLPVFLTLLVPQFTAPGMSEAVYDRDYVIDLIAHLTRNKHSEGLAHRLQSLLIERAPRN